MPDRQTIANNIFHRAMNGTPVNKGVPEALAKLIAQQSMHETGGYTSNAWSENNNGFGYKWVGSRYQDGKGIKASEGDYYGNYDDYLYSVDEVVDWIYRRQKQGLFPADLRDITTPEQYAKLLKDAGYYGDTVATYTAGLKRWAVDFSVAAISVGAVAALCIAVWALANIERWSK
jgi:hypothetical protein